jgi:hypothetical protein
MARELNPNVPQVPQPVQRVNGVTTRTITPTVFLTGQYQISAEAKAAELTRLMQALLAFGVFPNALEAARRGVPAGTYVVVDNPETPEMEFSVQVVPTIFRRPRV